MELIDSHAHIDFPQFAEDREAMLERARAAGVTTLLAIGTGPGPEKLDSAIPFAEQHDWIYATVGIHPHEAKEVTPKHLEELLRLAKRSEEHTSELQSPYDLVCRLLLEKKKKKKKTKKYT